MSSRRFAKPRHQPRNVDENQPAIVASLLAHGYSVFELHVPGDLLVGKCRRTHLVEVKRADGKQTDEQLDFARTWRGDYHLVRSATDALEQLKECGRTNGSGDGRRGPR